MAIRLYRLRSSLHPTVTHRRPCPPAATNRPSALAEEANWVSTLFNIDYKDLFIFFLLFVVEIILSIRVVNFAQDIDSTTPGRSCFFSVVCVSAYGAFLDWIDRSVTLRFPFLGSPPPYPIWSNGAVEAHFHLVAGLSSVECRLKPQLRVTITCHSASEIEQSFSFSFSFFFSHSLLILSLFPRRLTRSLDRISRPHPNETERERNKKRLSWIYFFLEPLVGAMPSSGGTLQLFSPLGKRNELNWRKGPVFRVFLVFPILFLFLKKNWEKTSSRWLWNNRIHRNLALDVERRVAIFESQLSTLERVFGKTKGEKEIVF